MCLVVVNVPGRTIPDKTIGDSEWACDWAKSRLFVVFKSSNFWGACFRDPRSLPLRTRCFFVSADAGAGRSSCSAWAATTSRDPWPLFPVLACEAWRPWVNQSSALQIKVAFHSFFIILVVGQCRGCFFLRQTERDNVQVLATGVQKLISLDNREPFII